jgi:hypothetical protein
VVVRSTWGSIKFLNVLYGKDLITLTTSNESFARDYVNISSIVCSDEYLVAESKLEGLPSEGPMLSLSRCSLRSAKCDSDGDQP